VQPIFAPPPAPPRSPSERSRKRLCEEGERGCSRAAREARARVPGSLPKPGADVRQQYPASLSISFRCEAGIGRDSILFSPVEKRDLPGLAKLPMLELFRL